MDEEKIVEQTEKKEYAPRPKWAFDSEYMTERLREVDFLAKKGITHTFVRKTPDYNVSQYKYKKTPALFAALVEFYTRLDVERELRPKRRNGGYVKLEGVPAQDLHDVAEVVPPSMVKEMKEMQDKMEHYANQIAEIKVKLQDDTE